MLTTLGPRDRRGARGSVLLLMPAAVLIVLVLGSIAVDFSLVLLGEREVGSIAASAANDAVTAGLDVERFRADGSFTLDPDRVRAVVAATVADASAGLRLDPPVVAITTVDGLPAVTVTLRGTVEYVFATAIPGAPDEAAVAATVTAVARPG